jgi:hypothetical protein
MWTKTISRVGRLFGVSKAAEGAQREERRTWGRVACDVETMVRPAGGEPAAAASSSPARVRNVSLGGINLTAPVAFEPGALLSVALPVGGSETELLACVVRCEPVEGGGGKWELGCTFAARLSDEDLRELGARREKASAPDQRTWVRYPCQAAATFQVISAEAAAAAAAEAVAAVLNVSASGIALQAEAALRVGDLLSLELRRDGVVVVTTLASVVRTATAPDGARFVGCNFIRELADEQVIALLS